LGLREKRWIPQSECPLVSKIIKDEVHTGVSEVEARLEGSGSGNQKSGKHGSEKALVLPETVSSTHKATLHIRIATYPRVDG
jgi:hypothetical protein